MPHSRRHVLALGATLFSAGCAGAGPGPAGDPEPTGTGDGCQSGVTVRARSFDAASDLPLRLDEAERALVAEAVAGEDTDHVTYAEAPLSTDAFVAHDGAFYRMDYTVVDVERIPAFSMHVSWERGREAPADAAAVGFESLSAGDREALRAAVPSSEREERPERSIEVRSPAPFPGGGDGSRLIGNVTWVRWRDRAYRVETAGDSETTRERRTVRYTAERVAATAEEFRRLVSERYLVPLDDVPADQRAVVETAVDEGHEECDPPSEGLSEFRERMSDAERLPTPHGDSWYVAFDGRRLRLEIYEWVH